MDGLSVRNMDPMRRPRSTGAPSLSVRPAAMPTLSIAVLTYQGEALLPDCLQSILKQEMPTDWELLVVDNGSTTHTPRLLLPHSRVVRLERNIGNIGGMNACFAHAEGDWVLFVANDVRLHPNCVARLWEKRCNLLQPVLYQPDGQVDNAGLNWNWPGYGARRRRVCGMPAFVKVPSFAATCFLLQRSVWKELGGFDAGLGLSHEDIDFALRLEASGYGNFVNMEACATHLMGQTIGRVTVGPLSPRYHTARLRVIRKHYRGLNRASRVAAVQVLDGLSACKRAWSSGVPYWVPQTPGELLGSPPPIPPPSTAIPSSLPRQ